MEVVTAQQHIYFLIKDHSILSMNVVSVCGQQHGLRYIIDTHTQIHTLKDNATIPKLMH